jgi:hypothetical protein
VNCDRSGVNLRVAEVNLEGVSGAGSSPAEYLVGVTHAEKLRRGPPAHVTDPLAQVVAQPQVAGFEIAALPEREPEHPGHLDLPQPQSLPVGGQMFDQRGEHVASVCVPPTD